MFEPYQGNTICLKFCFLFVHVLQENGTRVGKTDTAGVMSVNNDIRYNLDRLAQRLLYLRLAFCELCAIICNDLRICFVFVCSFKRAFDTLRCFETRTCMCYHQLHW